MEAITMNFSQIQDVAKQFLEQMEVAYRQDGEAFFRFKMTRPEWMVSVVMDAHGASLPNDSKYWMFKVILDSIAYGSSLEDARLDATCNPPVYTSSILEWLQDDYSRIEAANSILRENQLDDIITAIQAAWVEEMGWMFDNTVGAIQYHIEKSANNNDVVDSFDADIDF